jgi:hypothetical protein
MDEIKPHLFVKNGGLLVSLAQPQPIMQPDTLFLTLARNPTIKATIDSDPTEFEIIIWL